MTTTILTAIGILLATATAMMSFYYGGQAYQTYAVQADADVLVNAGQNVMAARQIAHNTSIAVDGPADLVAKGLMEGQPALSGVGTAEAKWATIGTTDPNQDAIAYVADDVDKPTCSRLERNMGRDEDDIPVVVSGRMGCVRMVHGYRFYAVVGMTAHAGATSG